MTDRTPEFAEEQAYFDILAAEATNKPAARAYHMAIKGVQEDVEYLWDMESFEDFRAGLDELLEFRAGTAEGLL